MWLLLSTLPCPADDSFWVTGSRFWSTSPCPRIIQPLCPVSPITVLYPFKPSGPCPGSVPWASVFFYYHLPPLPNSLHFFRRWWWFGGLVAKSCPALATPWTVACQALLSMGFSRHGILLSLVTDKYFSAKILLSNEISLIFPAYISHISEII